MQRSGAQPIRTLEDVRRTARILIIDDQAFPAQASFTRDQYHIERWAQVRNMTQLTDGGFDLILLDLHGVGTADNPDSQGLGILRHIKLVNPTQIVVAYSAQPWALTTRDQLIQADAVLDKGMDYLEFKNVVDSLLMRRYSAGYFVSVINRELGDAAADAPRLIPKVLRALRNGDAGRVKSYLLKTLNDPKVVDRVLAIISIGFDTLKITGAV